MGNKKKSKKHTKTRQHSINDGDKVLLLNRKKKGPFWYDPEPYVVTKIQGHQITAKKGTKVITRDAKNFKVIKQKHILSFMLYNTELTDMNVT